MIFDTIIIGAGPAGLTPYNLSTRLFILFVYGSCSDFTGRAVFEVL